jgi:hypothetical protein
LARVRRDFDWAERAAQLFEIHQQIVHTRPAPRKETALSCTSRR